MHLNLSRAARRAAAGLAALAALAACESSIDPRPQVAARLDIVAGNEQEAVVGRELPNALVVKVADDRGRPVRNQIVNFRVVSGGGSVFAGTTQTNDEGEARERWTLGTSTAAADSQRVEVRAVDAATGEALVFATFRATAKADVPAVAAPVGTASRTGVAGGVVADSPAVRVADRYNNPVAGVDVAWAVASGGGAVSPASSRTDASGVAKTQWTLGGGTGAQSVTGTAAGTGPLTFVATVGAGAVSRVAIAPRELRFGSLGSRAAVSVAAFDAFGNLVGGVPVTVISVNSAVASLETGTSVQARGNGTTRLVANVGQVSDTITVTVQQVAFRVAVAPMSASILVGDTVRLRATATDSGGAAIATFQPAWSSSAAGTATVSSTGLVTGTGAGTAVITATSDGVGATATVTVRAPLVATAFDAGASHNCAVTSDGTFCWGSNITRQLGGTGGNMGGPALVAGAPGLVAISGGGPGIAPGASHSIGQTCGITSAGAVICWGNDIARQVGGTVGTETCRVSLNFSYRCRATPEQVSGISQAAQLSAGGLHVCAVSSSGQAYCWGNNQYGQLGTTATLAEVCSAESNAGSVPCSSGAVPVAGGLTFRKVSAGAAFTCGLTTDGAAYCWGRNDWQQLGVSGIASSPTPVAVPGGHRFTDISSGSQRACGVTTDGAILCWGLNRPVESPYATSGGVAFRSVSTAVNHTCAVATSGAGYCFGISDNGELGNNELSSTNPVPVSGGLSFSQISVGADHSCGVQSGTGRVYCWGWRALGAVGNGIVPGDQMSPALVLR